eukprot:Ihof_evm4s43 gene=Ihof_evmTU4s43
MGDNRFSILGSKSGGTAKLVPAPVVNIGTVNKNDNNTSGMQAVVKKSSKRPTSIPGAPALMSEEEMKKFNEIMFNYDPKKNRRAVCLQGAEFPPWRYLCSQIADKRTVDYMFHPDIYKTNKCDRGKDCVVKACAFIHPGERYVPKWRNTGAIFDGIWYAPPPITYKWFVYLMTEFKTKGPCKEKVCLDRFQCPYFHEDPNNAGTYLDKRESAEYDPQTDDFVCLSPTSTPTARQYHPHNYKVQPCERVKNHQVCEQAERPSYGRYGRYCTYDHLGSESKKIQEFKVSLLKLLRDRYETKYGKTASSSKVASTVHVSPPITTGTNPSATRPNTSYQSSLFSMPTSPVTPLESSSNLATKITSGPASSFSNLSNTIDSKNSGPLPAHATNTRPGSGSSTSLFSQPFTNTPLISASSLMQPFMTVDNGTGPPQTPMQQQLLILLQQQQQQQQHPQMLHQSQSQQYQQQQLYLLQEKMRQQQQHQHSIEKSIEKSLSFWDDDETSSQAPSSNVMTGSPHGSRPMSSTLPQSMQQLSYQGPRAPGAAINRPASMGNYASMPTMHMGIFNPTVTSLSNDRGVNSHMYMALAMAQGQPQGPIGTPARSQDSSPAPIGFNPSGLNTPFFNTTQFQSPSQQGYSNVGFPYGIGPSQMAAMNMGVYGQTSGQQADKAPASHTSHNDMGPAGSRDYHTWDENEVYQWASAHCTVEMRGIACKLQENNITGEMLDLSENDLKEMLHDIGITSWGHKKRFTDAVKE